MEGQKVTFQEELRALLRRHEIEFDERYVRDWGATPSGLNTVISNHVPRVARSSLAGLEGTIPLGLNARGTFLSPTYCDGRGLFRYCLRDGGLERSLQAAGI